MTAIGTARLALKTSGKIPYEARPYRGAFGAGIVPGGVDKEVFGPFDPKALRELENLGFVAKGAAEGLEKYIKAAKGKGPLEGLTDAVLGFGEHLAGVEDTTEKFKNTFEIEIKNREGLAKWLKNFEAQEIDKFAANAGILNEINWLRDQFHSAGDAVGSSLGNFKSSLEETVVDLKKIEFAQEIERLISSKRRATRGAIVAAGEPEKVVPFVMPDIKTVSATLLALRQDFSLMTKVLQASSSKEVFTEFGRTLKDNALLLLPPMTGILSTLQLGLGNLGTTTLAGFKGLAGAISAGATGEDPIAKASDDRLAKIQEHLKKIIGQSGALDPKRNQLLEGIREYVKPKEVRFIEAMLKQMGAGKKKFDFGDQPSRLERLAQKGDLESIWKIMQRQKGGMQFGSQDTRGGGTRREQWGFAEKYGLDISQLSGVSNDMLSALNILAERMGQELEIKGMDKLIGIAKGFSQDFISQREEEEVKAAPAPPAEPPAPPKPSTTPLYDDWKKRRDEKRKRDETGEPYKYERPKKHDTPLYDDYKRRRDAKQERERPDIEAEKEDIKRRREEAKRKREEKERKRKEVLEKREREEREYQEFLKREEQDRIKRKKERDRKKITPDVTTPGEPSEPPLFVPKTTTTPGVPTHVTPGAPRPEDGLKTAIGEKDKAAIEAAKKSAEIIQSMIDFAGETTSEYQLLLDQLFRFAEDINNIKSSFTSSADAAAGFSTSVKGE